MFAYVIAEGDVGEVEKGRGKLLYIGRSVKCVGAFCREETGLIIKKTIL